ncbi:LysR family transcriptional regulator [Phascolarctobacterium sp.]|uniref:LysR family transcriptional regulator n=1 Tax=Phascolarctobacterium sp. TaxID=2049039 RepID=UPI0025D03110|nr:LysR family transcriptional regulator [Phascolarctobacterium sp.]
MQPKQLQYFITAYATKNIQRAAEKLFVSRQGISKTIRELEQELGADLFLRSSKGLEPTDFAEALFSHAQKLLDEYNYITGLNTLAKQKENVITIYALDNIVKYLTADFFRDFRTLHPNTILSIIESPDEAALNALLAQNADFAITTGPLDNTVFTLTPIFYTHYCMALSANHPLATKERLSYQDLHNQKIISKGRAYRCFRDNMEKYILGNGLNVDIFAEITDSDVALKLVKESNVIYISYDYIAAMHKQPDIIWKMLDAEITGQNMYIVSLKNALPRKICRDLQIFLLTWLPAHNKDKIIL